MFKKNFDEWSLNMRFKILNQLETKAVRFAKSCIEHGDKFTAKKILQRALKIIPDSEEIRKILENGNDAGQQFVLASQDTQESHQGVLP